MNDGINLATTRGLDKFEELLDGDTIDDVLLTSYLETGKSACRFNNYALVKLYPNLDDWHVVRDGIISASDSFCNLDSPGLVKLTIERCVKEGVQGVIVDTPRGKCLLKRGDVMRNSLVGTSSDLDEIGATLSFTCLARFLYKDPLEYQVVSVARKLAKGEIRLVDWTPDSRLPFRRGKKNKSGGMTPPAPGYVLVFNEWHRSSTCLLRLGDKGPSVLLGVDDNAYFGCELPDQPQTINYAYTSLMPESIRGIKGVHRQGEWFIVPVDKKEVPEIQNCLLFRSLILPVTSEDAHPHRLVLVDGDDYDELITDGRIAPDGKIYATRFSLYHPEHETKSLSDDQWYTFVKNTAIRSFSEDGVD